MRAAFIPSLVLFSKQHPGSINPAVGGGGGRCFRYRSLYVASFLPQFLPGGIVLFLVVLRVS